MRFSLAESMGDPSHYGPVAQAAEAAGFSSMVVPDSLCYPKESDSRYPYTPDGKMWWPEEGLEQIVAVAELLESMIKT